MKNLFLIRHGESEWNRAGLIQGQTDTPLTDKGIQQAHNISNFIANNFKNLPHKIYSSPMGRAQNTAQIIATGLNYNHQEIEIDNRLNDFNVGKIAGTNGWDQIALNHPELAHLRLNDPINFHPPGGESGAQFWQRLHSFLQQPVQPDITHIIVAHGIVNKFLRAIRRNIVGADIISLGEDQNTIYKLVDDQETEISINPSE